MNLTAYALPPWVGLTLTFVVCGGAFWKGSREEQLAAGGTLLSWLATLVLRDHRWLGLQWGAFASDTVLLILLTGIAVRTRRYWPLVAAAFQLLCVLIHVARLIDPGVRGWAYATGQVIFTQLLLISIGVGVINTWRGRAHPATSEAPIGPPTATRR